MPEIFDGGQVYLDAFWLLNAGRSAGGMGAINPIALAEILAYFQIFKIDGIEERDEYVYFVRALDATFLKYEYDRLEREQKRREAEQKRRPARR